MKREETIKWLKSLKAEIGKTEHRTLWHYAESIDTAIEALSTDRPSGGLEICGNSNGLNGTMYYICSLCGTPIDPCDKFCRGCGAYIKGVTE